MRPRLDNGRSTFRRPNRPRRVRQRSRHLPPTRWSAMPGIDESVAFVPVRIAIMTVSDTRDTSSDKSGDTLAGRIKDAGHELAARTIVTDDKAKIAAQLR